MAGSFLTRELDGLNLAKSRIMPNNPEQSKNALNRRFAPVALSAYRDLLTLCAGIHFARNLETVVDNQHNANHHRDKPVPVVGEIRGEI